MTERKKIQIGTVHQALVTPRLPIPSALLNTEPGADAVPSLRGWAIAAVLVGAVPAAMQMECS